MFSVLYLWLLDFPKVSANSQNTRQLYPLTRLLSTREGKGTCVLCGTWSQLKASFTTATSGRSNTLRGKRYPPTSAHMSSQIPIIGYHYYNWQGIPSWALGHGWLWHHQVSSSWSQEQDLKSEHFLLHRSGATTQDFQEFKPPPSMQSHKNHRRSVILQLTDSGCITDTSV